MPQLQINNYSISYELESAPRNKHVYLRIRDGKLVIRANPRIKQKEIEAIIIKKWDWIEKALAQSQQREQNPILKIGSDCFYLGKRYPLILRQSDTENIFIKEDEGLIITAKHLSYEMVVALLRHFYKNQTAQICYDLLQHWCPRMALQPQKISYRNNTSRWGSCSARNNISFNSNLAQLDKTMIEYVVVHELAHIQEKNHSPRFWAIVENHLPDYKVTRKQLRQIEKEIKIYRL